MFKTRLKIWKPMQNGYFYLFSIYLKTNFAPFYFDVRINGRVLGFSHTDRFFLAHFVRVQYMSKLFYENASAREIDGMRKRHVDFGSSQPHDLVIKNNEHVHGTPENCNVIGRYTVWLSTNKLNDYKIDNCCAADETTIIFQFHIVMAVFLCLSQIYIPCALNDDIERNIVFLVNIQLKFPTDVQTMESTSRNEK